MGRDALKADAFTRALGTRRGVSDPQVLVQRLLAGERQLDGANTRLRSANEANECLRHEREELSSQAAQLRLQLGQVNSELDASLRDRDRDRARYAAMRAGGPDPVLYALCHGEHHGIWTPGRPYLTDQHVYEPRTGACYQAKRGGASVGVRPGQSSRWRRCPVGKCARPMAPALRHGEHPVSSGHALRQSVWWWDVNLRRWAIEDLEEEHFHAVIDWLRQHAEGVYTDELAAFRVHVPCPTWAYPTARSWLADTPLMRALLAERRRRQRRSTRHAPAQGLGAGVDA